MRLTKDIKVLYGNGEEATFHARTSVTILTKHRDGTVTVRAMASVRNTIRDRGSDTRMKRCSHVPSSYLEQNV